MLLYLKKQQLVGVVLTPDSWCLKILLLFKQEFSLCSPWDSAQELVGHCHLPGQLSSLTHSLVN